MIATWLAASCCAIWFYLLAARGGFWRAAQRDDLWRREAAEEVASFENRLANVEASLTILKWMVGFNLVLTVAIVGMLFFVLANELAANAAATTDTNAAEMPRQSRGKATGAI